jgi:sugar phosphate isomerase/epimerase
MVKFGLKLWSDNEKYLPDAESMYANGIYDYIELYIVPQTYERYIKLWKSLEIPFIIHCTHSIHGFNLAIKEKSDANLEMFSEVKCFADRLNAAYIVVHPGIEGLLEESIRQILSLRDRRLLVENKPYLSMLGEYCRGSTLEELQKIIDSCGIGFCFDIPHAFNTALHIKKDYVAYAKELSCLWPKVIHISDGRFSDRHDAHLNIGEGEFDFVAVKEIIFSSKAEYVTLETRKKNEGLADFIDDLTAIKKIFYNA